MFDKISGFVNVMVADDLAIDREVFCGGHADAMTSTN